MPWAVRVAKSIVNISALALTALAILEGADPTVALAIGAVIVAGPEAIAEVYDCQLKPTTDD